MGHHPAAEPARPHQRRHLLLLYTWNDFLQPLIYLNDDRKFTLALGLAQFRGLYNSEWHLLMAASMLVVAPVLVLFVVAQRYFVAGITLTGIKG